MFLWIIECKFLSWRMMTRTDNIWTQEIIITVWIRRSSSADTPSFTTSLSPGEDIFFVRKSYPYTSNKRVYTFYIFKLEGALVKNWVRNMWVLPTSWVCLMFWAILKVWDWWFLLKWLIMIVKLSYIPKMAKISEK